jgi:hypothetical protein
MMGGALRGENPASNMQRVIDVCGTMRLRDAIREDTTGP